MSRFTSAVWKFLLSVGSAGDPEGSSELRESRFYAHSCQGDGVCCRARPDGRREEYSGSHLAGDAQPRHLQGNGEDQLYYTWLLVELAFCSSPPTLCRRSVFSDFWLPWKLSQTGRCWVTVGRLNKYDARRPVNLKLNSQLKQVACVLQVVFFYLPSNNLQDVRNIWGCARLCGTLTHALDERSQWSCKRRWKSWPLSSRALIELKKSLPWVLTAVKPESVCGGRQTGLSTGDCYVTCTKQNKHEWVWNFVSSPLSALFELFLPHEPAVILFMSKRTFST